MNIKEINYLFIPIHPNMNKFNISNKVHYISDEIRM